MHLYNAINENCVETFWDDLHEAVEELGEDEDPTWEWVNEHCGGDEAVEDIILDYVTGGIFH